jgi:hypothetical protein
MEIGEELGSVLAAGGGTGRREGEVGWGSTGLCPCVLDWSIHDLGFKCSFSCLYTCGPTFSRPVLMGQVNNFGWNKRGKKTFRFWKGYRDHTQKRKKVGSNRGVTP